MSNHPTNLQHGGGAGGGGCGGGGGGESGGGRSGGSGASGDRHCNRHGVWGREDGTGCFLPPILCNYAIEWILGKARQGSDGVELTPGRRLTDLGYAEYIALLPSSFGGIAGSPHSLRQYREDISGHPRNTTEMVWTRRPSPVSRDKLNCYRSGAVAPLEASKRSTKKLDRHGSAKHGGSAWTFGIRRPARLLIDLLLDASKRATVTDQEQKNSGDIGLPEPPQSSSMDGLRYPRDIFTASAHCLI
ncbi:unnamed protein product [Schistocephalus solidus]|uniref:Uncharacterized protein n=1 Tax=Schistocephalus solidus TaxID=70667 RepID=A0A183STJ2_SCHSO|nr:unnamed protein product [Schistocephalus solidus]